MGTRTASLVSTTGHSVSCPFSRNQRCVNQDVPLRMGTRTPSSCGHYWNAVSCSLSQGTMVTCVTWDVPLQNVFFSTVTLGSLAKLLRSLWETLHFALKTFVRKIIWAQRKNFILMPLRGNKVYWGNAILLQVNSKTLKNDFSSSLIFFPSPRPLRSSIDIWHLTWHEQISKSSWKQVIQQPFRTSSGSYFPNKSFFSLNQTIFYIDDSIERPS